MGGTTGSGPVAGMIAYLSPATVVTTVAVFLIGWLIVDYYRMLALRWKMPPGPLPWPIIGNTFMLPDRKPWIYFEQLAKDFQSPVITFWIGRNPTVWINDASSASELLDRRAGVFSSRPRMIVFGELGFDQETLVTMRYGDRFRVHRRLTHSGIGVQKVRGYQSIQSDENKAVLLDLLTEPEKYVGHMERYAASVVSIIGFGRRIPSPEDPIITEVIAVMQRAAELNVPGKEMPMLMESFGFLAKFPDCIAPWKRKVRRNRGRNFFYALAEEAVQSDDRPDCYSKLLFAEAPKFGCSETEVTSLSSNLFGAGSDTSSSTLVTFVLACCAYPEALPKAWEELDRVVGPSRMPSFEDEPNLPYVKALVKEVFRWRSVAIIGGQPHAPTRDEFYQGKLIPKNCWVQGNVWAIHHNEKDFPDPDVFDPERFLDGARSRPFPNDRGYMTFGWGRRICPGQPLAEQGTFISIARLLWAFNIQKALDGEGREIPVDIFSFTDGLNMKPHPFECRITPRSAGIKAIIEKEGKEALEALEMYNHPTKYRLSTYKP